MKKYSILNAARLFAVTCFLSATAAFAGPGPLPMYVPVKASEISAIKPGTELAMTCPKCHAVLAMKADKEKSYERSMSCPKCQATFTKHENGSRGQSGGSYTYSDKQGHEAYLLRKM